MTPSLNLVVLRCADVETSRRFYAALGIEWAAERHGNGPDHYAARIGALVLELYPGTPEVTVRLGFSVAVVDDAVDAARRLGATIAKAPRASIWGRRAVVIDPDGRAIELIEPVDRAS